MTVIGWGIVLVKGGLSLNLVLLVIIRLLVIGYCL